MHRCCWLHFDISINLAGNRLPSDLGSRRDPAFLRRGVAGAAERDMGDGGADADAAQCSADAVLQQAILRHIQRLLWVTP